MLGSKFKKKCLIASQTGILRNGLSWALTHELTRTVQRMRHAAVIKCYFDCGLRGCSLSASTSVWSCCTSCRLLGLPSLRFHWPILPSC